jgi:hypothetical protein
MSQMTDALEAQARARRRLAAEKYKPTSIRLLLVAEAPPEALDRYFYFEDVRTADSLFRYVCRSVLTKEPTREGKADLLGELRAAGVFLIDVLEDPDEDEGRMVDRAADVVRRCRELHPEKLILIKATVYDAVYAALRDAGLPVVDVRVPFPGAGQQRNFMRQMMKALDDEDES